MKNYLQHSYILQYADDTTLCITSSNLSYAINNLSADMQFIEQYCQSNKLVLNMLLFSGRKHYNIDILNLTSYGSPIEFVTTFKYLGVHIDNKLTFMPHVATMYLKNYSAGYLLAKYRSFLPKHILVLLFNALGHSNISFGDIVYLTGCNSNSFAQVASRYVDCGRIILSNNKGSSRTATMLALKWPSFQKMKCKSMLVFLYKVINSSKPANVSLLLRPLPHHHSTRLSKFKYFLP